MGKTSLAVIVLLPLVALSLSQSSPAAHAASPTVDAWSRFGNGSSVTIRTASWTAAGRLSGVPTEMRVTLNKQDSNTRRIATELAPAPADVLPVPAWIATLREPPSGAGSGVSVLNIHGIDVVCRWDDKRSDDGGQQFTRTWTSTRVPGGLVRQMKYQVLPTGAVLQVSEALDFAAL